MLVGLCSSGVAAHSVTSNPSGTWKRSSGIRVGCSAAAWAGTAWPAAIDGGPNACSGTIADSTSTIITVSTDTVSRGIWLSLIVGRREAGRGADVTEAGTSGVDRYALKRRRRFYSRIARSGVPPGEKTWAGRLAVSK